MGKMKQQRAIKPKFCFCVVADLEKVAIKTKASEHKEKICDYYVYVYHSSKMKAPTFPKSFPSNIEEVNYDDISISTCKIKGESSRDMYAEAVIHSEVHKHFNNVHFKNKIIQKILTTLSESEQILRSDVSINGNSFKCNELGYVPKTKHFLNPHCVDGSFQTEDSKSVDESDIKFYNMLSQKQLKSNDQKEEEKNEIKIHDETSNMQILNDIQSVRTTKRGKNEDGEGGRIPRQVKSYHYTVIDRYLHIIVTFNSISYEQLEILKKGRTVEIYVSSRPDDCMTLSFKQKLSDNIKAYFNEKGLKLTISVELLY
ncbi:hypothetical protein PVIIG_02057 [Plasmodium vivax India VII]|uniref:Uncharacterized protein n=6 Tax=Plasmodium vivax TaxID=5855 RepID=A5K7D4_PLAVS|nr:hypothetical protein, conserved [Plasmodium vivax]KMZ80839.1 hypothetical protein PVIIG_02057 [Plasmodium vivax India VII]KMZ86971.1 hypothetical protein PVBG_02812 [Plasmodium vivax Brazil I]KMZ93404.1 hypothetical protein PVMG_00850 [Plasmodium vivax Mauritania I]KNA00071.1 hypothetical protein PVNG_02067 [Plasmodium vivax North Korean]EDL44693.1 hypothetical protein, conserved [Plasmodium vivax]|eukprot:XP_001614420.1 hypothetical protein [Plasmodium vivax Sal-1]